MAADNGLDSGGDDETETGLRWLLLLQQTIEGDAEAQRMRGWMESIRLSSIPGVDEVTKAADNLLDTISYNL